MKRLSVLSSLLFPIACGAVDTTDWPTWRHDSERSGATVATLPSDLTLQWSRDLGKPDPAFAYHFRLCADQSYEPVAAGGVLFVPSNVTDGVTAYDLASGSQKWHFITEGPVRFAPVVEAGAVYFGSDDGYVYAVDATSGVLKWKTRGAPEDRADYRMLVNERMCSRWPVRGGLMVHNNTLYFGCGLWPAEGVFLVALDPKTGTVKWRNHEIAQIDDGLEEHGKMADIGLPPHGYLAMIGGRVAMPSGRALAAFANPETGKLDPYNSFYAKVYPVPRGSWALCANRSYWFQGGAIMGTEPSMLEKLPAGPVSYQDFALFAGKDLAWVEDMIRRKFIDGSKGMVNIDLRDRMVGLDIKAKEPAAGQLFQLAERPVLNMAQIGTRHEVGERGLPVFTGELMFRSEFADPKAVEVERGVTRVTVPKYDQLRCYKLNEAHWKLNLLPSKRGQPVQRNLEFPVAWELSVKSLTAKMLAGDRLFLAGANQIVAVSIPVGSESPRIVWQEKVQGFPVGVIAANDHLIVTTDEGRLYVFGSAANPSPTASAIEYAIFPKPRQPEWEAHVRKLKSELPQSGIALVLGWNSGALAHELARQTALHIIVAEPDPSVANEARSQNFTLAPWARRIHIVSGKSDALKLPPYFAGAVLSESFTELDQGARLWTRIALDSLRPYTGLAVLPLRPLLIEQAQSYAAKTGGYEFSTEKRWTTIRRRAAPSGTDEWTHEAGSGSNTFASTDKIAVPPFGLLWYSGSIDREFSPAFEYHHNRNPYPVVATGNMYLIAGSDVHAVDAYSGRHLWKAALPDSPINERRLADHRMFSRPTDQNIVATADRVYVFQEHAAHPFDPLTGAAYPLIRTSGDSSWDEARIGGDSLFIAAGKTLSALDRRSGATLWTRTSEQEHTSFCLSSDRVFVVEYSTERGQSSARAGPYETKITVLNALNAETIWSAPLKAPGRPGQTERSAGKPTWSGIFQDNPLKPTLHYNAAHNIVLAIVDRHQFYAFDARIGSPLWQYDSGARLSDLVTFEPPTLSSDLIICDDGTVLDIRSGKPAGPRQVGGRGTGCNRFVGSDALISFRSALACIMNLKTNERTYFSSTRPGCTNSMIPASGLLNAPNFAHGCVCNYPFLTSFSLFHLPEAARWAPQSKPDVQTQNNPNAD